MKHADLVERAKRWLRNSFHCGVILCEHVAALSEIPDAIGWVGGRSILVECKASVSDFMADKKKLHRHPSSEHALGDWRFYLVPRGLIQENLVPSGWGLYEVAGRSVRHAGGEQYRNMGPTPFTSNVVVERRLLLSALRKRQQGERGS